MTEKHKQEQDPRHPLFDLTRTNGRLKSPGKASLSATALTQKRPQFIDLAGGENGMKSRPTAKHKNPPKGSPDKENCQGKTGYP